MAQISANQLVCAVSSPSIEELVYGITRLPASGKRTMLEHWLEGMTRRFILLSYEPKGALWLGRERARLEGMGKPAPRTDGEIAAIAATNNLTLVTRNTRDFQNFSNLRLENWFSV